MNLKATKVLLDSQNCGSIEHGQQQTKIKTE